MWRVQLKGKGFFFAIFLLEGFFLQVYRSSIPPQRNAAKEYFVLAMAAMQVLLSLLLSLLALPGQRCKHCVAAKEFFFFGARYGRNTGTTQLLPKLLASLVHKYK